MKWQEGFGPGDSAKSSHLTLVASVPLPGEPGHEGAVCPGTPSIGNKQHRGKFSGKGVCTKHLEAFQAFFEVGTGRYWGKNCGLVMYFQLFLK